MKCYLSITIIAFLYAIVTYSTSQYRGVAWNDQQKKYRAIVSWQQKKYDGGHYTKKIDAAKRVNQLCDELGIDRKNAAVDASPAPQITNLSKYKGVAWHDHQQKWKATVFWKCTKYDGGNYDNELDTAKRVNQICDELGIKRRNPEVNAMPTMSHVTYSTFQYKGVCWNKCQQKWSATVCWKQKQYHGGSYGDQLDAAKRVNQLCDDMGIERKNPEVNATPTPKITFSKSLSQYTGVTWSNENKNWRAAVYWKNVKYEGGYHTNELDAAKQVNNLCDNLGIQRKNPEVDAMKTSKKNIILKPGRIGIVRHVREDGTIHCIADDAQQSLLDAKITKGWKIIKIDYQPFSEEFLTKKQNGLKNYAIELRLETQVKTGRSEYKAVYWEENMNRWKALVCTRNKKKVAYYENELDAARKVNQMCDQFRIKRKNPHVDATPNKKLKEEYKTLLTSDAIQAEIECLIKILDENNDPTTLPIKDILISIIRYEEQTVITDINLRTKNSESALSLAAQHGFSNLVQFLISKGAEKTFFTNEHHTPLSLAVIQNHLKVVEVLLEDWISPNSHEEPFLHLSPIFNVKSREIAQLLVNNDAVTSDLYNNKNQSPLTVACQNGFLDVVEFFLDDGLDINHPDIDNKTPLFYARKNEHHKVVNLLISKGAYSEINKSY